MTRKCVTDEQYGWLWRRLGEVARRVNKGTINFESTMDGLQNLIEAELCPSYDIIVDYSRSLANMIRAGKYDWVNGNINAEHFPLKGKGKHKLSTVFFHFNRYIDSKDAIAEMDEGGCRPGNIEELLALGEKYPYLQKKFRIVALGSVWCIPVGLLGSLDRSSSGDPHMAYLDWDGSVRNLDLQRPCYQSWDPDWHFLAIRK